MSIQLIDESRDGIEICNKDLYKGTNIKAVLFDMDGVILDTEKLYTRFWREAAAFYGYEMTQEMALSMRSLNHIEAENFLKDNLSWFVDYSLLRAKRVQLMELFISKEGVDIKPGIYELIAFLKENGVKRAVATSSPQNRAQYYLGTVGLFLDFQRVVTAQMVRRGKPEPDIFIYAAERLGLKPEECIVLEDSPNGIMAAYRAGCVPVMIPDLDGPNDEMKDRIYAVVDNLATVIDLMEVIPDPEEEEEDIDENEVSEETEEIEDVEE